MFASVPWVKKIKLSECLRKGCKFIHMNRNAAYPSYSNRPKDRNSQNMPKNSGSNTKQSQKRNPDPRDVDHQLQQNKICFNFSRTGRCKYGRFCRYVHPNSRNQNSNLNGPTFSKDNVNFSSEQHREVFTFLGEIKDIVKTLKDFNATVCSTDGTISQPPLHSC